MKTIKTNMTPMTHLDPYAFMLYAPCHPYAFSTPLADFSAPFITPPLLVRNWRRLHFPLPVDSDVGVVTSEELRG